MMKMLTSTRRNWQDRNQTKATRLAAVVLMAAAVAALMPRGAVARGAEEAQSQPGSSTSTPTPTAAQTFDQRSEAFSDLEWVTRPSRDVVIGFTITAEIGEVLVSGGQRVKAGQLMIRAKEAEALAGLAVQRVRAANTAPVDSARASLDLAEVRYKRIKEADDQKAASPQELDERRVAVEAAKAALANAQSQASEEQKRLVQLEEQAKRYRLEAPFDGIVEQVTVDVGQTVEAPQPVIRVVNIDTLWIDLPVPTARTLTEGGGIKSGAPAWVLMDLPGAFVIKGKVLYVSPVADAAAETRRVRVEVPNPNLWPPGTKARVRFTEPTGAATQTDVRAEAAK